MMGIYSTVIKFVTLYRGFASDVIGCHVSVQVVHMIIIYQEKILDLHSFTSITNIKRIKFQSNAQSSLFEVVKFAGWYDHRVKPL